MIKPKLFFFFQETTEDKFESLQIDKADISLENETSAIQDNLEGLSLSNTQHRPFRDGDSTPCHYESESVSIASSSVPPAEIKKRVKQAFAKQQKLRSQRRLKRGEASLVNKKRRELAEVVTSSKDLFF